MKRNLLAHTHQNGLELQLWEHYIDDRREFEIVMNGVFIMASYNHLSSELMVRSAIQRLKTDRRISILIGGLGMGYSVKEACSSNRVVTIDVVEIVPMLVEWNKHYFQRYNQQCLEDDRVRLFITDFYDYVLETSETYDIVCLDIDNGPLLLVQDSNRRVYESTFLEKMKTIMRSGAIFGLWSGNTNDTLGTMLSHIFNCCWREEVRTNDNHSLDADYIYFGQV